LSILIWSRFVGKAVSFLGTIRLDESNAVSLHESCNQMAQGARKGDFVADRRGFLEGAGMLFCSSMLGGRRGEGAMMAEADELRKRMQALGELDPKNVVDQAKARGLADLSDALLYQAAGAVVSRPPQRGMTSFTLHAPLEVMARYGLLRLVDPAEREMARLQMIASAAVYGAGVKAREAPPRQKPFPGFAVAAAEFSRTFKQADADGMEALVLQVAEQFGTSSLVSLLSPLALPTLTGASHSHIGLWLLLRHGEAASAHGASLLRAAARSIAADPKGQMKSFSGMAIAGGEPLLESPEEIEKEILAKLADPPKGKLTDLSIRSVIGAGEATGNADAPFGDFIRHDLTGAQIDAAFRAVLRVCAHSMLQDDLNQAKFGWTHCLTLPQSACGLASLGAERKLALAATLVWITAYRSVLSRRALDFGWAPEKVTGASIREALHTSPQAAAARVWHAAESELPEIRLVLATQASIRNDLHLVKYTRATFDMGTFDPAFARLYLAGAAHLCAVWIKECPRETLLDHLLAGRTTP
jgi:hypothetical protein